MVRIIAPACPHCGGDTGVTMIYWDLPDLVERIDPIDLNLAGWIVMVECRGCEKISEIGMNDCKAPLGYVEPAGVKE